MTYGYRPLDAATNGAHINGVSEHPPGDGVNHCTRSKYPDTPPFFTDYSQQLLANHSASNGIYPTISI